MQIGDWVNLRGEPLEVASLDLDGVVMLKANKGEYQMTVAKHLEPIPLSEGWLKRMGFKKGDDDWWCYAGVLVIRVALGGSDNLRYYATIQYNCLEGFNKKGVLTEIMYVHKLQQFIRLCWVGEHPADGKYLTGNKYKEK